MTDPVIAGFAALVRHRKRIEWSDPDLAMLADHMEENGEDDLAEYLRLCKPEIYAYSDEAINLPTNRTGNVPHWNKSMWRLFRLFNPKEPQ